MPKMVTPVALAGYSENIYTLDTEGKFATGKYVFEVRLAKGVTEHDEFAKKINALAEEAGTTFNPLKDGDEVAKTTSSDKRAEFARGHYVMKFKSAHAPKVVDTQKQVLNPDVTKVMGGDKVRVAFDAKPFVAPNGTAYLPVYLNAVQLVEKGSYDGGASVDAFDDIEGFTEDRTAVANDDADF